MSSGRTTPEEHAREEARRDRQTAAALQAAVEQRLGHLVPRGASDRAAAALAATARDHAG